MEQADGANALDATGNGHTGVQTGPGTILQVAGKVNFGAQFPIAILSAPTYYTVPDAAALRIGAHDQTFWGWYRPDDFVSGGDLSAKTLQWAFSAGRTSGHDWLETYDIYYGGVGSFTRCTFGYTWTAADWQFWMVEYTESTKTMKLYRNNPTVPVDTQVLPLSPTTTTSNLFIGAQLGSISGRTMTYDEMGIAAKVFTPDERICIFNSGAGGTYPLFCNNFCINFQGRIARKSSGSDMSCGAYGAVTNFQVCEPIAAGGYWVESPVVDLNGAQPGDKIQLKITRKWDDPLNTSLSDASLEEVAIEYDVS